MTSAHPPREHNPHVWAELDRRAAITHVVDGTPAVPVNADGQPVDADGNVIGEEVDEQWQEPTDPDGTDSSTSSPTAGKPSQSPEPSSPKPAPSAESQSEQDQTTSSTAPGDIGSGTAAKAVPSRRSAAKSK